MAVNPVLAQDDHSGELFPLPEAGEAFVLKRDGIDFEGKLPRGGKLTGRGVFFMSSKRIIFVATEKSGRKDFKSFAIPLVSLQRPKFEQPIFGANYLGGVAHPLEEGSILDGGAAFSLTFNNGGCGTFLPLFYQLLHEMQEQREEQQSLSNAAMQGRLNQVAFVDPSDPSVLYLSQPTARPDSEQRTAFDIEPPSAPPAGAFAQGSSGESSGQNQQQNCSLM
eukprot:TRINITY_DN17113_c0_g2_i1.p1 TRINITY_DN17113_c0_g2~~TRINITY_DN17113_c0_g2_i1.p1  ORF type:complete len:222 (+),score=44.25 TRINITY_DN17113_c0_g2_i1:59-724(+)